MSIDGTLALGSWLGLIHFETLVFVIGTAIFTVAMARERAELRYMAAASIDPLTGVSNRRAFMETAEELLKAHASDKRPLSLILFDLDRFKSVNDNFGHAAGDTVLKRFADVARSSLRASDILGRPGGEEFAVLLPGSNKAAALDRRRTHPDRRRRSLPHRRRPRHQHDRQRRRDHRAADEHPQFVDGSSRRGALPRQGGRPQSRRSLRPDGAAGSRLGAPARSGSLARNQ